MDNSENRLVEGESTAAGSAANPANGTAADFSDVTAANPADGIAKTETPGSSEPEHTLPKKKIIAAALIIVILLGLGGFYYFIKDRMPSPTEESRENNGAELLSAKISDIFNVSVKTDSDEFTVTQKNGSITISPETENISPQALSYYLEQFTLINSVREIKNGAEKLSEYGISENNNYFEVTLKDKSKHRFCIGKSVSQGYYYCLTASDNKVWIVSSSVAVEPLKMPAADNLNNDTPAISIDQNNIYAVSLKNGGKDIMAVKRVGESTALPYNFYSSYELTYPVEDIAYGTDFSNFLKSVAVSITPIGHMGEANAENCAKYGIGEGYTVVIKDSSKTHTITLGNKTDLGVYMTYNDYPYIYLVSEELYNAVENVDPLKFITPYIDLYKADDISKIVVKTGKNEYTLGIDNSNGKYSLNGAELSADGFNEIFDRLTDITSYASPEANPAAGSEVCSILFTLSDGTTYTRSYYDCGSDLVYMTTRSSGISCTVKKAAVDSMIAGIENGGADKASSTAVQTVSDERQSGSSFPVMPTVCIAAAVILAAVLAIIILKKKNVK